MKKLPIFFLSHLDPRQIHAQEFVLEPATDIIAQPALQDEPVLPCFVSLLEPCQKEIEDIRVSSEKSIKFRLLDEEELRKPTSFLGLQELRKEIHPA